MTRRTRTELLALFEPRLGAEAATALVEEIETVDPDRLATKADLTAVRDELRQEMATKADLTAVRDELRQEMATKADLAVVREEMATKADLATTRDELHHRIDLLEERLDGRFGRIDKRFGRIDERFEAVHAAIGQAKNEVLAAYRGEIATAVSGQTRAIIFAMAGTVASLGGLALALTQFA